MPFFFLDRAATNTAGRYYRAQYVASPSNPQVTALGRDTDGSFRVALSSGCGESCVVQATTNLVDWISIYTNTSGGPVEIIDPGATGDARRFYRALVSSPPAAPPDPPVQVSTSTNGILVRVDGAVQPCVILQSTNQNDWVAVATNLYPGQAQAAASTAMGTNNALTTFAAPIRSAFLASCANGFRAFNVSGSTASGVWLQLTVTKTNGTIVTVGVTNQSGTATVFSLTQDLVAAINACQALQGSDGVFADDLVSSAPGTASFNLYARGAGRDAAGIQARLTVLSPLFTNPTTVRLDSNLADLQARNHVYFSAGVRSLGLSFALDTTTLPDGFHDLTAIAYEGTHVRTQTRISLPVEVRNSSLSATLTLLDLGDTASAQGTYHIQVAANTNNVTAISLYTTGGLLGSVSNQSSATFTIDGPTLGAGLHPFYALVQTASGKQYRTAARWVRPGHRVAAEGTRPHQDRHRRDPGDASN